MAIIHGKIELNRESGIIAKMTEHNDTHRSLQGYTIAPDGSHFASMLKTNKQTASNGESIYVESEESTVLVEISYSNVIESNKKTNLGHANDCTYYDGNYYVITSDKSTNNGKKIYRYGKYDLTKNKVFTYTGNLSYLSSITHISGKYFLVGQGKSLAVCEETTDSKFNQIGSIFSITDTNKSSLDGLSSPQGMHYHGGNLLYKAYGVNNNNTVKTNYIAKFRLSGNAPHFTSSELTGLYEYTDKNHHLFELESLGSHNSQLYTAVKSKETSNSNFSAAIYKVTLNNL